MFVSDSFDRNLDEISTESGMQELAFDLVDEADSGGWIETLYQQLCALNPDHPRVFQLQEELQDLDALTIAGIVNNQDISPGEAISQNVPGSTVVREVCESELKEPENSAHLVITAFWKGEKKLKQLRILYKLCYYDSQASEIVSDPHFKEEDIDALSLSQCDFPKFLKSIHEAALGRLRGTVADHHWTVSLELFLPLDALCLPLSSWCGANNTLIRNHSVVLGCADRFDDDRPAVALKLYNQLELQWERFLATVPDEVGSSLQSLKWLDSTQAATSSLRDYQGFRCLGGWLVPGEWDKLGAAVQQNWKDLIGFGVPLALWICQGDLAAPDRQRVFDSLAQGTRFDLLEKIPSERDVLHRSGQCVGVLHENLTYAPKPPKLPEQQQLFSWPG